VSPGKRKAVTAWVAGVLAAPSKLGMLPESFRAAVRLLGLVLHQPGVSEGTEAQFQPHFQPLPAPEDAGELGTMQEPNP